MKRYLGISAWRYGGWRDAPNKLTPEQVQAAMHAPTPLDQYPREGRNAGRCGCFFCGAADGCEGPAEHTVVGDEVTLILCTRCFEDHRNTALAVIETGAP